MRTLTIELFDFNELNDQIKNKLIHERILFICNNISNKKNDLHKYYSILDELECLGQTYALSSELYHEHMNMILDDLKENEYSINGDIFNY